IGALGIVRACHKNDDGTSNLLLQGLCRVEIVSILQDEPYRRIRVRALASHAGASAGENETLRRDLARLLRLKSKLAETGSREIAAFLKSVDDPEAFVDIAAFSLCEDTKLKQKLLETLDVHHRLQIFGARLRKEIGQLKLRRTLQGRLPDEHISDN
ncbi:MAG: LON peptidase substrate-binding domain-containing protein, partial [Opitutus sp.]